MARYGSFIWGDGTKWGLSTQENLLWAVQVDWYDSDFAEGINEAPRVIDMEWTRGRDSFLESNTSGIRFPTVGRATISLDNHDLMYDARNPLSAYYGYIQPGHKFRIGVKTVDGTAIQWRFTGRVSDIRPSGWRNGYVDITAEDALQWLYDQDIDIDVQQSIRIDEAIALVLDTAAWPWTRLLSISSDSLAYWWASQRASTEISDLTASGIGYFSVLGDGTARFINRSEVSTDSITLEDDNTLNNPDLAQPWEMYKNIIRVKWYPRQLQAPGIVWSDYTVPLLLAPGASYTTFGNYAYNNVPVPALYSTISASDMTANTAPNGSGTDLTSQFSASLTDFGTAAKLVVTNNSASTGYITLLQITGRAINVPYTGSFVDNRGNYQTDPRTWTLELPWQQNSARAESIADIMADYLSEARTWPVVEVESRFDIQFTPDIFDTLRYHSAYLNIDSSFRVGKIRERWLTQNGQAVRTSFVLEPYLPGPGAWTWPITNFGVDTIFG